MNINDTSATGADGEKTPDNSPSKGGKQKASKG
jgi:hypothetical protein